MPEITRLVGRIGCFELDFVERETTPEPAMKLGIHLHLAGLSLSNTISILDMLGVKRCRSTVHNWVQRADLQPADGADPGHVAVDETVIQLNNDQFWLYAAVDSAPWLQAALHRHGLNCKYEKHGNRNSVERVFRELKRRTNQFLKLFQSR